MTDPSSDPFTVDAAQYAALVREASDADLAAGLQANRELILDRVFAGMAEHLDPDAAGGAEAVMEWRITGRDDGGHDRYQVVIRGGACLTARGGGATPDAVYTIAAVDFLRLITANATGPELFMTGRLSIDGDLILAAMTQTWFRAPGAPASTGA